MAWRLPLAAALLALVVGAARADRETAEFVTQRAEKALLAKTWAEAESLFRKALEEDATLLRARLGLAEALLGAGQRAPGVTELRRFVEEAGAVTAPDPALAGQLAKAKKRLGELDALGGQLDQKIDAHIAALLAFAAKWREKDADMAITALEQVLRLRPDHAKAAESLQAIRASLPVVVTSLFNGKDANGWTWFQPPMWQVREGVIAVKAENIGSMTRTETVHGGNFDVLMEVRFIQDWGANRTFVLCACMKSEFQTSRFGVFKEDVGWREMDTQDKVIGYGRKPIAEFQPPLDIKAWNVFELRYRKDDITTVVNGKEVFKEARPPTRVEGFVTLWVQDCAVEIKRVEVIKR